MGEPVFIVESDGLESAVDRRNWLEAQLVIGREKGATFFRASTHPDKPALCLIEGWSQRPDDQGDLRFNR